MTVKIEVGILKILMKKASKLSLGVKYQNIQRSKRV